MHSGSNPPTPDPPRPARGFYAHAMPHALRLVLLLTVLAAVGCRTYPVVTPPPPPPPAQAAAVYLAHYDFYHTSLLLPQEDGELAEYTYADYDILALDKRTTWTKVKAILLPSRGTLGRGVVRWDHKSDQTLLASLDRCWKLSRYSVDAGRVERVRDKINATIDADAARYGTVEREGMTFVKAARPYSLLNDCNHILREWLVALGFNVPRRVALADFQTPDAVHTFAPGRETGGMVTDFNELVGERPEGVAAPDTSPTPVPAP